MRGARGAGGTDVFRKVRTARGHRKRRGRYDSGRPPVVTLRRPEKGFGTRRSLEARFNCYRRVKHYRAGALRDGNRVRRSHRIKVYRRNGLIRYYIPSGVLQECSGRVRSGNDGGPHRRGGRRSEGMSWGHGEQQRR